MNMPHSPEFMAHFTPDLYQSMAANTAYYEEFDNPQRVLEQGLGDEVIEMLEQAYGDSFWTDEETPLETPLPTDDLKGELGDLLWYVSQLVRIKNEPLSRYVPTEIWEAKAYPAATAFDDVVRRTEMPVHPFANKGYDFAVEPIVCLGLLAASLDDAKYSPVVDSDIDEDTALEDMFRGITIIANIHGFSLREICEANIAKLAARERKPHTIEHVSNSSPSLANQKLSLYLNSKRI